MPSSSSFVFHQYMAKDTISISVSIADMMVIHSIYTKCSKYADKEKDN